VVWKADLGATESLWRIENAWLSVLIVVGVGDGGAEGHLPFPTPTPPPLPLQKKEKRINKMPKFYTTFARKSD